MSQRFDHEIGVQRRTLIFYGILTLFSLLVAGRLFDLQILRGPEYRSRSEKNRLRLDVLPAPRGRILDRQGRVLVDNFASFVLTIDPFHPALRNGVEGVLARLGSLIDRRPLDMLEEIKLSRKRTFLPIRLKRNLTSEEVALVEEAAADLPGVAIRVEALRRYPPGGLAAHLLGYVGDMDADDVDALRDAAYSADDLVGKSGIEERYDAILHGTNGKRFVEVDALGRPRTFQGVGEPIPPSAGRDVFLSIDLDLQRALENAMDGIDTSGVVRLPPGKRVVGAAVAVDVWNGEVLALVSRPGFDPKRFAVGLDPASWKEISGDEERPLLDRAIQSRYPPGSVFKPLVAVAALDSGLIATGTVMRPCYGSYQYGRRSFGCWKDGGHGSLDLWGAIEQSCDVYFYQVGDRLGVDGLARYAHRFRMDERTGIDIDGEVKGLIPDSRYMTERYGQNGWSRGAALNLAIGQGELLFTPIQLAAYVAAIANGGQRVHPRLVRAVQGVNDGVVERVPAPPAEPLAGDLGRFLRVMRQMMHGVVASPTGTGRRAAADSLEVAGKTGTAQNPHGEDHAIFISFAPAEAPEVALAVVLERAGGGGAMAAPVAGAFWKAYRTWRQAQIVGGIG